MASNWPIDRLLIFVLASMYGALASGVGDDARTPVPEAADLESAEKLVRDVFAEEYGAAKNTADRVTLAKKILATAMESAEKPAEKYVLFRVARDVATSAGDVETALKAVEAMNQCFRVDSLEMKIAILEEVGGSARLPSDHRALLPRFTEVFDEAIASERLELARQIGKLAMASAVRTRDANVRKEAAARLKELDRLEKAFAAVKQALEVLNDRPTDPDANLLVGKYRWFSQGNFDGGLPMLALGSDPQLKELAVRELDNPAAAEDQVELGDGWWKLADDMEGKEQRLLRQRAGYWYQQVVGGLAGLTKVRVSKRMRVVESQSQEVESTTAARPIQTPAAKTPINLLAMIDPEQDTIQGTWRYERGVLVSSNEKFDRIYIPYIPPEEYAIEITATRLRDSLPIAVGLVGGGKAFNVIIDCDGHASGLEEVDGKKAYDGNASVRKGKVLTTGRMARILCQVDKRGVRVVVDGRVVVYWPLGFDRLSCKNTWSRTDERLLLLGTSCSYAVHSIMLLPVSGPGKRARPSD